MFWIGRRPRRAGDAAERLDARPARSRRRSATTASHGSPASTRRRTVPSSRRLRSIPRVTTRITLPSKPSSATTTLEPPPSTSQSSTPDHRSQRRGDQLVAGGRLDAARSAGPADAQRGELAEVGHASATRTCALPSTVSPLKVTVRSMRAPASSSDADLGDDGHVGAVLGVDEDRSGEPHLVVEHLAAVAAQPVDDRLHREAHGQHPVREHAGQARPRWRRRRGSGSG